MRTQPHRETQAARQLENQDFRTFVPRILKSRRHARKFETVRAPLFPATCSSFLISDVTAGGASTAPSGSIAFLCAAASLSLCRVAWWSRATEVTSADGVVRCGPALEEGQSIRVTAGPFAELMGTLERLDEQGRVRVLLDILGGKIPVLLSQELVASTDAA